MTEDDLRTITGLLSRYKHAQMRHAPHSVLFAMERDLLVLGLRVDNPVGPPDPHAPEGGSTVALKAA